ncbi:MAG: uroporphyrinogen decarboxylase [Deltaproteobacteria bacterium RBG_13_52_11]|nr:MAG: uroporphyrinogen decarboxylase [Deltaproteobacteria bacterium RBG_13_52_11]
MNRIVKDIPIFLRACQREPTEYTPVWLMRQAGRFLKEYRSLRRQYSFLTLCKTPELATKVTLLPIERLGVDAAIIFADILLPLEPMGIDLEFTKGEGPVIHNPPRSRSEVEGLRIIEAEEDLPFVMEAVRSVCRELKERIPLIGFSGAPFTLASYLIEGGGAKDFVRTKSLMYQDPPCWHFLMEKLSAVVISYLNAQIRAGAAVVQLFDSWAGTLSPRDYEEFVLPHNQRVFYALSSKVPAIHFATGAAGILGQMKAAGGDIIGVDWRIDLDEAWQRLGYDVGIQGNLDPAALLSPPEQIESRVAAILHAAGSRPGHIFNLGHGVLPQTPEENVITMVEAVHRLSRDR